MCSGTTVIQCNLSQWTAGQEQTIDLGLLASASGNYSVGVKVIAANDTNPADNEVAVAVSVNSATPPPTVPPSTPGPPSGGGGGGHMEWLAIALLSLVTLRRIPKLRAH